MSNNVKFDMKKLEQLNKVFKDGYSIRVGILGGNGAKQRGENMDMAGLGAVHEFGSITKHIPARSFLRVPLEDALPKLIKQSRGQFFKAIITGKLKEYYTWLANMCANICKTAFKNGGSQSGKWKPNSPYTVKQKGSSNPLVDTGDLSRSITAEVKHDTKRK